MRNANIYRNGEVKKRSSSTQTAAQSPLDPRTLNGGQETLKKLLREKTRGKWQESLTTDPTAITMLKTTNYFKHS